MTKNGLFDFSYGVQGRAGTANKQHFYLFFFLVWGESFFFKNLGHLFGNFWITFMELFPFWSLKVHLNRVKLLSD